jgi:hypothetical protein
MQVSAHGATLLPAETKHRIQLASRILKCARQIRGIAGLAIVSGGRLLVTRSDHNGLWLWDLDNEQQVGKPSLGDDDPMATGS